MCANQERNGIRVAALLTICIVLAGCTREPGSAVLTRGALTVACDEAVSPTMLMEAEAFQQQYPDSKIRIVVMEGREAVSLFASDSIRVIVLAREFNTEERNALTAAKVPIEQYHVAESGVAVVGHPKIGRTRLRMSEADSIFNGSVNYWSAMKPRTLIDAVIGGPNSSTNEVFKTLLLNGKPFAPGATPMASSGDLVRYIARHPGAIGIVGVAWVRGWSDSVSVLPLGGPAYRPDTTAAAGQYYSPAQAYIFQGYYPASTPVYIYSREVDRDLSLGFIAFATSAEGQKVVVKSGLVPKTMPVRLIQLTSEQVK